MFLQARQTAAGMSRLPRSLTQWVHSPTSDPTLGLGRLPSSRLSQILMKHFRPAQSAQSRLAHPQYTNHASRGRRPAQAAPPQSHLAASTSTNPRVGPYLALPLEQQHTQVNAGQCKARGPVGAAAPRRPTAIGGGSTQWAKSVGAAGRMGRTADERRPQSANSSPGQPQKGRAAIIGKGRPRARSVSPGSQYHFSCTSSVPDNASSWRGDAASAMSQLGINEGKGRAHGRRPVHQSLCQTETSPGPVHSTYVLPAEHLISPARSRRALHADQDPLQEPLQDPLQGVEEQQHRQTAVLGSQGRQWGYDGGCDQQAGLQPAGENGLYTGRKLIVQEKLVAELITLSTARIPSLVNAHCLSTSSHEPIGQSA